MLPISASLYSQVLDIYSSADSQGTSVGNMMFLDSLVSSVKSKKKLPQVTKSSQSFHYDRSLLSCQSWPWVTVYYGDREGNEMRDRRGKALFFKSFVGMCEFNHKYFSTVHLVTLNAHIHHDQQLNQRLMNNTNLKSEHPQRLFN